MRIDIGMIVRTSDGRRTGTVQKIVIDSERNKVTHLVIQIGFLFRRFVVVPLAAVRRAMGRGLVLKLREQELGRLPDFVFAKYAAPPRGHVTAVNYPAGGVLWPWGYAEAPLVVQLEKAVSHNSVEIDRETEVFALDGKMGAVRQVVANARSGRVTGFVVGEQARPPEPIFVPLAWVSALGSGRVGLNKTRADAISPGERKAAA